MQIVTAKEKRSIKISKSEWIQLGQNTGWLKEATRTDVKKAIQILNKQFPNISGIQEGEAWGASKNSIHLGDAAEGGEIEDWPAADYNASAWDTNEKIYLMGIHKKLVNMLEQLGYVAEWHDSGTVIAYPNEMA